MTIKQNTQKYVTTNKALPTLLHLHQRRECAEHLTILWTLHNTNTASAKASRYPTGLNEKVRIARQRAD